MQLGLDNMSGDEVVVMLVLTPMTFDEKAEALRQELGMTQEEADAFLIDMGEEKC